MCNVLMACVPTLIYGHKLWLPGKNRTRVAKVDGLKGRSEGVWAKSEALSLSGGTKSQDGAALLERNVLAEVFLPKPGEG